MTGLDKKRNYGTNPKLNFGQVGWMDRKKKKSKRKRPQEIKNLLRPILFFESTSVLFINILAIYLFQLYEAFFPWISVECFPACFLFFICGIFSLKGENTTYKKYAEPKGNPKPHFLLTVQSANHIYMNVGGVPLKYAPRNDINNWNKLKIQDCDSRGVS